MATADTIRQLLDRAPADVRRLHTEHLNPLFVRALELVGVGRDFVRAEGLKVWDAQGKAYWDFLAGYGALSLGHNHPEVKAALVEVLKSETPHFLLIAPSALATELARRLAKLTPGELDLCTLGSSGSEAVEAALKLARAATSRTRFVSAKGSYHGTTMGALSVTGSPSHRAPFEPLLAGCVLTPWGDLGAIERELRRRDVAAVVLEPMQGEGGIRPAPMGWLRDVGHLCGRYGTLLVLDEIQTGLGRCGRFFACEAEGVSPDVLLLAKGLSGGLAPVSALLTSRRVWQAAYGTLERYELHCSTFSGGPLACAAALATLEVIEEQGLVQHAAEMGRYLGERLRAATAAHPLVREVRGKGLFWGIELAVPEGVAADLVGQWLVLGLLERGIVTQVCSNASHVVRVQPPLPVTKQAIDRFSDALADTLKDHAKGIFGSLFGAAVRTARNSLGHLLGGGNG